MYGYIKCALISYFNETYADSNSTNGELTFVKMSLTFSLKGKKGSGSRNQIIYYDLCIVIYHNPKKHFFWLLYSIPFVYHRQNGQGRGKWSGTDMHVISNCA